jgi:hypothetical protein
MTKPHCDDLVLHAPGECIYCDLHSLEQHERIRDGINFTGQNDPAKSACPSTLRRPLSTINRWAGNRPSHTVRSDNLAPADDRVPEWAYRADMQPPTDDEPCCRYGPWGHIGPCGRFDEPDQSGLWLGIVLLALTAIVAFAAGWLIRGAS